MSNKDYEQIADQIDQRVDELAEPALMQSTQLPTQERVQQQLLAHQSAKEMATWEMIYSQGPEPTYRETNPSVSEAELAFNEIVVNRQKFETLLAEVDQARQTESSSELQAALTKLTDFQNELEQRN